MQSKTNTIFVTGSSGFIGKSLINSIIKIKKYKVICLSNLQKIKPSSKYTVVKKNELFQTVKKIDYVIHAAACDEFNVKEKKEISKKNKSLDSFITKVVKKYKIKKLIFLSSNRVYESCNESLILENSKTSPTSVYGQSKLQSEKTFKKLKTNLIILRLPSVISKNFSKGLIFRLVSDLKKKKKINVYNPNSRFNNIITISDLINMIMISLNKIIIKKTKIINISSCNPEKFTNVISFLAQKLKRDPELNIYKVKKKSFYYSNTVQKNFFKRNFLTVKSALNSIFT